MKQFFYIFLDIDGVLYGWEYIQKITDMGLRKKGEIVKHLDPKCLQALNFLIDSLSKKFNVQLVISSVWRSDLQDTIKTLKHCGLNYKGQIQKTGVVDHIRGLEILQFLENKPNNNNFVVIDDDVFDIEPYISKDKIITPSLHNSFSLEHAKNHLKKLNLTDNNATFSVEL